MKLSKRVSQLSPSITLAISAKAKQMKAQGIEVIDFGAGEPDFDTPLSIKQAGIAAINSNFTRYTASGGIPELKKAVSEKFKQDNNLDYEPGQILISCGAKHSLFNAIFSLCDEDEEVIIPAPYWVSYEEQVKMAGAKPVIINKTREENDFKLTPQMFDQAITSKTRAIILNSPSNPSGLVYDEEELAELAMIAVEKRVYIISDEVYEYLIYDGQKHFSIASLNSQVKELTITINAVSKAYAMTGWRIGYAAGPKEIIKAMDDLQSHSTSNPTSIAQKAALAALTGPQDCIQKMVTEFDNRRRYIVERLNRIKGFNCRTPAGAFYAFPNVSGSFNNQEITDSFSLTEFLLDKAKVAVVPGSAFGAPNYLRLSYATSMENITEGLNRIEEAMNRL